MKEILTKNMTCFRKEILTETMTFLLCCLCIGTFTACGKRLDQSAPDGAGAEKKTEGDKVSEAGGKAQTSKKQLPALEAREFKDVAYDTVSEAQKLDLYLPETGEGPFPLVVFIHGGGWFGGDKADGQEAAWITLRSQGYAGLGDNSDWSSLKDFIGEDIGGITREKLAAASPISYISERMAPTLLQHGSADTICPAEQSRSFYREAVRAAGEEKVQLDIMEGAVHGDAVFETPENMERVRGFLDKHLRQK